METQSKLDELLNELKTPKQEFEHPEPGPESEPVMPGESTKLENAKKNVYAVTGQILFHLIDVPFTTLAAVIAGESVGKLRIDKESREYLIEAYTQVAELYQWENIPPWLLLIAVGGASYGGLLYNAYELRKEKMLKKKEEQAKHKSQPKLSVIRTQKEKKSTDATQSKTNNNTGHQRDGEKHTGGKTVKNSQEGADSNA